MTVTRFNRESFTPDVILGARSQNGIENNFFKFWRVGAGGLSFSWSDTNTNPLLPRSVDQECSNNTGWRMTLSLQPLRHADHA